MQNMTEICLKISKYIPKYTIKLKICSNPNGTNMPLIPLYVITYSYICLCMGTPFIEKFSDFEASFNSAHIEKYAFVLKSGLYLLNYMEVKN